MFENSNNSAIVCAAIYMAHEMDLLVVAEGVEGKAAMNQLKSLSVTLFKVISLQTNGSFQI